MRSISMETVEAKRAEILATLKDKTATHEPKVSTRIDTGFAIPIA